MRPLTTLVLTIAIGGVAIGCSCDDGGRSSVRDGGPSSIFDGAPPTADGAPARPDGAPSGPVDAYLAPDPDAYFFADPPPSSCFPDGGMGPWPDPPGGTPDCPDDRAREGCRCDNPGDTAACWPGPRRNRMRGICRDGVSTCMPRDEFGGQWGPCVGAVLPVEGVTLGPSACECFSMGRWEIDNLMPCFIDYGGGTMYAVSTFTSGASGMCPTDVSSTPPPSPQPGTVWSNDRLTVDCAGRFMLCYSLRAGDAMAPAPTDCVVTRQCVETWYPEAGAVQELPPLPSWSSSESACATQFATTGGYGEMSVRGVSVECDDISDGSGGEYVFNRIPYCPLRCSETPDAPECERCAAGGSGSF
jgi:hypothetical protein